VIIFNMATLGAALVSSVLGHSAAEKAFRPWWDNLEDFLVYGLVMLGKLAIIQRSEISKYDFLA
jgi:hypothetical protein